MTKVQSPQEVYRDNISNDRFMNWLSGTGFARAYPRLDRAEHHPSFDAVPSDEMADIYEFKRARIEGRKVVLGRNAALNEDWTVVTG